MVIGERSTLTAGKKSLLGEESRDEGLEENECGDMGLASGEKPPCCSTGGRQRVRREFKYFINMIQTDIFRRDFIPFLTALT